MIERSIPRSADKCLWLTGNSLLIVSQCVVIGIAFSIIIIITIITIIIVIINHHQ